MTPRGANMRRASAYFLGCLALLAGALAVWALATGGFRTRIAGVPLSVRGALRPAIAATLFGLASLYLFGVRVRTLRAGALPALAVLPRAAPWLAGLAAASILGGGLLYGSKVAGSADSSGYVSQADLWLRGDLKVPHPDVGPMPWPDAEWTFSPLGYQPAAGGKMLQPTYAPGLPLLMAGATLAVGVCGPYLIGPLCAALLVWATYLLGARLSGPLVGLIAALALAASPAFLFMTLQPMSDIPNAAFWTLSMLFAMRGPLRRHALLAGALAGVAVLIRPNLAPLAAIPALLLLASSNALDRRTANGRVALYAAACAPFLVIVGAVFNHLYGSPFRSGYGSLEDNYQLANVPVNLSRYLRWFMETQGPVALAFLLTPFAAVAARDKALTRMILLLFVLVVLACYLAYNPFDDWWYLRFLLPAFPFIFVLAVDAVSTLAVKAGPVARGIALLILACALVTYGIRESRGRYVLDAGVSEARYADAAHYVQTTLPAGSVVMAMQHSGSISYYTDKLPFRYDLFPAEWIDRAVDHFTGAGRPVYLLLEDWEVPVFAERFRGQRAAGVVSTQPVAATFDGRVRLFSTRTADTAVSPVQMPQTRGCLHGVQ